MTRLVFLDTETTGLEVDAHVWDLAMIVRDPGERDREIQFFVEHDYSRAAKLPEPFLSDYQTRYDPERAVPIADAVVKVAEVTAGAHIIGAVPNFDTERLARPLRAAGIETPPWHYHLLDVETLVVGWLAGRIASGDTDVELPTLPWDSDELSALVGITAPKQGAGRHTALGDARWTRDVHDAVLFGVSR